MEEKTRIGRQLLILSDCKAHSEVSKPTHYLHVFQGRMYSSIDRAVRVCTEKDLKDNIEIITVSAKYGLLWGPDALIENYQKRMTSALATELRSDVCQEFVSMWDTLNGERPFERVFVSLGSQHRRALPTHWISNVVGSEPSEIIIAHGSLGTRQGQVRSFLCGAHDVSTLAGKKSKVHDGGGKKFKFMDRIYEISRDDAMQMILQEFEKNPVYAHPVTWFVLVGEHKISCKYAASCLLGREIDRDTYTTHRAIQILAACGFEAQRIDID